ncbi:MAG: tRNA (guanosine(37)-N1)-methyltransferase TrmD [Candidatus Omnitrophica bacterium]|nr:tRNA (guanosine(37)-N1)-methyltransferase TrmD [Candidatus Omnitrophota bacterium]MCM8829347.1 tRNA (guanosine(37)-N1)-methyltransferase TrmD [Candidatus Omnitrophota bacterium]
MRIDIITIFPEIFSPLDTSIVKRARSRGIIKLHLWNLRDFSRDKHKKVDDAPYGGGKGMVLACEPIFLAIEKVKKHNSESLTILTSPQGEVFTQKKAEDLSKTKGLIIICGHYEGVDERVRAIVDYEISIGDYVLTGGELPAMVIVDCIARLLPGVLPEEAPKYDSFSDCLLDWPCYTRPEDFRGLKVPEVLLSGDHARIKAWRLKQSIERTKQRRPDLYARYLKKKGGKDASESSSN